MELLNCWQLMVADSQRQVMVTPSTSWWQWMEVIRGPYIWLMANWLLNGNSKKCSKLGKTHVSNQRGALTTELFQELSPRFCDLLPIRNLCFHFFSGNQIHNHTNDSRVTPLQTVLCILKICAHDADPTLLISSWQVPKATQVQNRILWCRVLIADSRIWSLTGGLVGAWKRTRPWQASG